MQEIIKRVERCRVCGSDDWLEVMSFGSVPLANGLLEPALEYPDEPTYPSDVVVCRDCWLMSLRQVVDPEALFGQYVYVSSDSDQIMGHMRRIVDWSIARAGLAAGDLVVEMGSNVGIHLALFAERGLRVVGVDPARNLAQLANQRGVPTIADFFGPEVAGPILREHGEAKLVLGRQCFAHIDDVHNVVKGVDAILAPDGVLVIEVPYLVDLLAENQFDTVYHEHLSYFSVGTLSRLFAAHGLQVIAVERAAVHGGSIVVFAARVGAREPEPSVAEIDALEVRHGVRTEQAYVDFAARSWAVAGKVGALVRSLAAQGKRVAGYGAPSKGSALLMTCGLGPDEVEFVTDTTPLKHGKVLPGSHIPVWSPEQARAKVPDYYLLLAWNYAEEIFRKERAFLAAGGRFIVPIPQPRIVSAEDLAAGG